MNQSIDESFIQAVLLVLRNSVAASTKGYFCFCFGQELHQIILIKVKEQGSKKKTGNRSNQFPTERLSVHYYSADRSAFTPLTLSIVDGRRDKVVLNKPYNEISPRSCDSLGYLDWQ